MLYTCKHPMVQAATRYKISKYFYCNSVFHSPYFFLSVNYSKTSNPYKGRENSVMNPYTQHPASTINICTTLFHLCSTIPPHSLRIILKQIPEVISFYKYYAYYYVFLRHKNLFKKHNLNQLSLLKIKKF